MGNQTNLKLRRKQSKITIDLMRVKRVFYLLVIERLVALKFKILCT